ncbi:MAG: PDZ domain-containing protein [Thermoleophilaceae bacterium]|nr:PDZ domain-containing protein [Thermoleophilaceae bacterium]
MNRLRTPILAVFAALVALAAGLWLGGHPTSLPNVLRQIFVEDDRALRAEVIDTIEDNFARRVDGGKLRAEPSPNGIVRSLGDRYSRYITPAEWEEFDQSTQGQFEGVGLSVGEDKRGLRVLTAFERSPAAMAGLRRGDVITAVDGESIAGEPSELATAKIKGRPGTSVELSVLTPSTRATRTLRVERARIEVPVARGKLVTRAGRKLGVASLAGFSTGAHGALRVEVKKLLDQGATGLVLDLRHNPGGLLDEAVLVSSAFIEDGPIVSTRGRAKSERKFEAQGQALAPKLPLVALVDGGSASASEIVTGALRDRRRATIVGTRTFGKGVFQEVKRLSNGGALSLTVGSYYLPGGENISDKGITPQVKARDLPRTPRDEALNVALDTLRAKAG